MLETFEQRFPITYKVDNVIVTIADLLLADSNRRELPDDYYKELQTVIEQLKMVSNMVRETETN